MTADNVQDAVILRRPRVGVENDKFVVEFTCHTHDEGDHDIRLEFRHWYELAIAPQVLMDLLQVVGVNWVNDMCDQTVRIRLGADGNIEVVGHSTEDCWFSLPEFREKLRISNPGVGRG